VAQFQAEAFGHGGRDESAEAFFIEAAELSDLLDVRAAGEGELVPCHEEDGFNAADREIDVGLLKLVVQVNIIADATNDHVSLNGLNEFSRQALVGLNLNAGQVSQNLLDHLDPFGRREQGWFLRIMPDGHNEFIGQNVTPCDDVEVAFGDRIECPGENGSDDSWVRHNKIDFSTGEVG